jgi:GAF domain-containing protein
MKKAPIPSNEDARLEAVHGLNLLDTEPEERFDWITKKALAVFSVPISTITLIDKDREWYKSCQGVDAREASRSISFCGHAMFANDVFVIEDTLNDKRFRDNPQVTGVPHIRFYAGVALHDKKSGLPVGVFCIKDTKPRTVSAKEISDLLELAGEAEKEINTLKK